MLFSISFGYSQDSLMTYSPYGVLDSLRDHWGNTYRLSDIRVPAPNIPPSSTQKVTTQIACTNNSYFEFYFEQDCGMDIVTNPVQNAINAQRRDVLCRLAEDLSLFIKRPAGSTDLVRIWVRDFSLLGAPPGAIGGATAFYITPTGATNSHIVDNQIWQTIVSGVDAYNGVVPPLSGTGGTFFHGMMAFDFTTINWNLNLTTPPTATQHDLYTVLLHEMTHALGFASLIDGGTVGQPSLLGGGYYNRYDKFLRSSNNLPLLTQNSGCANGMYNFSWNSALGGNTIHPNPSSCIPNMTTCATAVRFTGSVNQPAYTPNCWEPGSSLSHFEDLCHTVPKPNDEYYVMSNVTGQGAVYMKHFLKVEERNALCDLGYELRDRYGYLAVPTTPNGVLSGQIIYPSTCAGGQIAGVNDGLSANSYAFSVGVNTVAAPTSRLFTGSDILSNDVCNIPNNRRYRCVEVIYGGGSITGTTAFGSATNTFTYIPAINYTGLVLLRYIPVNNANGNEGNVTYVFVYVGDCGADCVVCSANMISNGGFEINNNKCGPMEQINSMQPSDVPILNCWRPISSSADLFNRGGCSFDISGLSSPMWLCDIPTDWGGSGTFAGSPDVDSWNVALGTPLPAGVTNDFFVGMASSDFGGPWNEAIVTNLTAPMQAGNYTLGLWARVGQFASNTPPTNVTVWGMVNPLCAPYFDQYQITATNPALIPLTSLTIPANNIQWAYYSIPFSYSGTPPLNGLVIANSTGTTVTSYVFIDDISLTPNSLSATTFNVLPSICQGETRTDLSQYITNPNPNGIFFGPAGSVIYNQVPINMIL